MNKLIIFVAVALLCTCIFAQSNQKLNLPQNMVLIPSGTFTITKN